MEIIFSLMSPLPNPLQAQDLLRYGARMAETLAERARRRLRDEMIQKHLSQRDLSDLLGGAEAGWSQSRIAKVLNGRVDLTINALEALAFAVGLSPTEIVRDHGLEFCAEMLPHELRLLEHFRQQTPDTRDALLKILKVAKVTHAPDRYAKAPKKSSKKPKGTPSNDPRMTIADAD